MLSKTDKCLIAGMISFTLTIPFLYFASAFWVGNENAEDGLLGLGALSIFLLGAPLTLIPMKIDLGLTSRGLLVVLNLLFIIQWVIWSQLLVYFYRKFSKFKE